MDETAAHAHFESFFGDMKALMSQLDLSVLNNQVSALSQLRERKGRLFILGVGGSAANASHAVNDFRKLCHIEAYTPTDNVSELTARINDEGWDSCFVEWLKISRITDNDMLLVLSVGGGNAAKQVSMNIVKALQYAKGHDISILGIVGRDGGETKKLGNHVLVIPTLRVEWVTPCTEAFQAIVWHGLVSHPDLQAQKTKW
jgi:D-sedoheptulose 7-phosphate isomerase